MCQLSKAKFYANSLKTSCCLMLIGSLFACSAVPQKAYNFDDGTTQGWRVTGIFDDAGTYYVPLLSRLHFEGAQYPNSFPGGDPLHDKKGSFAIEGGQLRYWAQKSGFPKSSKFWNITAYYTGLNAYGSTAWQGIKGVKVSVGDNYGIVPGHISANIGVRATVGGNDQVIAELDAGGKPLYRPVSHQFTNQWSHLSAKLNIPANAQVYQVWITFRGDWKSFTSYEGQLLIDQVEAVK